jgi:hypothetical protein
MKIQEILQEGVLKDEPHIVRTFDIHDIGNRRFMFHPNKHQMILGDARGAGKGRVVRGSHAEEYYELFGTNNGFDDCARGWVGCGGSYNNGIIHFAPMIPDPTPEAWQYYEAGWKCLEYFVKNGGATPKTVVRGFGRTNFEQTIADIFKPVRDTSSAKQ